MMAREKGTWTMMDVLILGQRNGNMDNDGQRKGNMDNDGWINTWIEKWKHGE